MYLLVPCSQSPLPDYNFGKTAHLENQQVSTTLYMGGWGWAKHGGFNETFMPYVFSTLLSSQDCRQLFRLSGEKRK